MSVFICWSGDRSRELATRVRTLLSQTIPELPEHEVFISDQIEKGANWFASVVGALGRAAAGIVCLTAENLDNPWMHFEAGALASGILCRGNLDKQPQLSERDIRRPLFTILHGVTGAELHGPLSAFQGTATTRPDMEHMVRSLAEVLGPRYIDPIRERRPFIHDNHWNPFNEAIENISVPVGSVIRDLDRVFHRKTFNEPLNHCTDQAWLRRYDGVRETQDALSVHRDRVKAACKPHNYALFELLLAELNGYAMAMQSLLLRPVMFDLSEQGELKIDAGILTCCENRRLAIRSLSARLLHPLDDPLRPEAVTFMAAETNEERKMIVHGIEGAIRREREAVFDKRQGAKAAIEKLTERAPDKKTPIDYRASSWDLDRISYYLLIEYFRTAALRASVPDVTDLDADAAPQVYELICAARDVEMEEERYRARAKGGSLMPLTYALRSLQALGPQLVQGNELAEAKSHIESALKATYRGLGRTLEQPAGGHISELLKNLATAVGASVGPK